MKLIDWVLGSLTSSDIVDAYFVVTNLYDVDISDRERTETAYFDALASATTNHKRDDDSNISIGKRVCKMTHQQMVCAPSHVPAIDALTHPDDFARKFGIDLSRKGDVLLYA